MNGHIKGYKRRFWQSSEDHRGTPEYPGRVVTLIPSFDDNKVFGVAFVISEEFEDKVRRDLDYREKDGYNITETTFYPNSQGKTPFKLNIYIGVEDSSVNPFYVGESSLNELCRRIARAHGPSGANRDYLYQLAAAMRRVAPLDHQDEHLDMVHAGVLSLLSDNDGQPKVDDSDA